MYMNIWTTIRIVYDMYKFGLAVEGKWDMDKLKLYIP